MDLRDPFFFTAERIQSGDLVQRSGGSGAGPENTKQCKNPQSKEGFIRYDIITLSHVHITEQNL